MRKLFERLLIFFVGLPLIIASIFFLPQYNYLVLHIELLVFSLLAILEMRNIIATRLPVHSVPLTLAFGLVIPVAAFMYAVFGFPQRLITFSIAISSVSILFLEFFFSFSGKFDKAIERVASSFILIIYPGYFVMYLAIMTVWQDAGSVLSLFFLMVFGCDSLAWFFGMLLGKNNRGLVPASPNKSIAGFIGGYAGAIGAGIAAKILFPEVFAGSVLKVILLGFMTASAAIVGDIIESIFKRSAGMKDSGKIIPGRGGVLDSIDSILLAAPVFYIMCDFLFGMG
jgi:phosphatidate cytidylyltransferase